MPTNTAAWLNRKHARLEVGPAEYTTPEAGQLVVRNRALAINPLDWIIQAEGNFMYGWLRYPAVLGADVAGEVVEVGSGVTRFRVGDRVTGLAVGTDKDSNRAAQGAFQQYTVLLEDLASPIPPSRAFEEAVTLPLAVSTAAAALFQARHLGLRHPGRDATPTGEVVLIWGGSTSVGSQAIRLAVRAGYEVVTTASPRNFDSLTALGAARVFDYRSPTVESDLVAALAGRRFAGAVAMGTTGAPASVRIAARSTGNRVVAIATPPVSFAPLVDSTAIQRAGVMGRLIATNVALQAAARPRGVKLAYIDGSTIKHDDVGALIFREYLPTLLADEATVVVPAPTVAGHGLGDIQDVMDRQRRGVSAEKLVVTLRALSGRESARPVRVGRRTANRQ